MDLWDHPRERGMDDDAVDVRDDQQRRILERRRTNVRSPVHAPRRYGAKRPDPDNERIAGGAPLLGAQYDARRPRRDRLGQLGGDFLEERARQQTVSHAGGVAR
jgi:hypothetical protein